MYSVKYMYSLLVTMCYDNIEYQDDDDEDNFFKWYEGYKK